MIKTNEQAPAKACPVLPSDSNAASTPGKTPGNAKVTTDGAVTTIDVRRLEPPQPLLDVLRLLDASDVSNTVIIHHDRDPLLLYPELEDRGWSWRRLDAPAGELHLQLTKNNPAEG